MTYDLVVVVGEAVIDGTSTSDFVSDVGIADGCVAAIGQELAGQDRIGARGKTVAPRLIDIHTHYDAQIVWDRAHAPSCRHDVRSSPEISVAPVRPPERGLGQKGQLERLSRQRGDPCPS